MARKTKNHDLDVTRPSPGGEDPAFSGVWEVFEDYEICEQDGYYYLEATGGTKRAYRPLVDEPYLFPDLARLWDGPHDKEALYGWLKRYGLLGLHYDDGRPRVPEYYPEPARPPLMYFTEGGPGEGLMSFWMCIQQAHEVLSLYEAVLNRDKEQLTQLIGGPQVAESIMRSYWDTVLRLSLQEGRMWSREETLSEEDLLIDHALIRVWGVTQNQLSNYTYPAINHELPRAEFLPYLHQGGTPLAVHRLGVAWGFRNLLGAAYLQFYWLITSRAEVKRCEYCGRILNLAASVEPDGRRGRKPRSDKDYCRKSCRQNDYYHRKGKFKRQGKPSSRG